MPAAETSNARSFLEDLLRLANRSHATEILISAGNPPSLRRQGRLERVANRLLSPAHVRALIDVIFDGQSIDEGSVRGGLHRRWQAAAGVRWLAELHWHRGEPAMWLCLLPEVAPSLAELGVPDAACEAVLAERGLLFVSSRWPPLRHAAILALVRHRHARGLGQAGVLDPNFPYDLPAGAQPAADLAGLSVAEAAGSALSRGCTALVLLPIPDVTLLEQVVAAAGNMLLIAPLSRGDQPGGWPVWLRDVAGAMAEPARAEWHRALAGAFRGALRLCPVPRLDGQGDLIAADFFSSRAPVGDAIARGAFDDLAALQRDPALRLAGMQALDDALFNLHDTGAISYESALRHADNVNGLRLEIKLKSQQYPSKELLAGVDHLDIIGGEMTTLSARASPEPAPEAVQLRAYAPEALAQGGTALVDIWACLPRQAAQVAELAASAASSMQVGLRAGVPVARGSVLAIGLQVEGLAVESPVQTLVWLGEPASIGFLVQAPASARVGTYSGRASLTVSGMDLGWLHFTLRVVPAEEAQHLDSRPQDTQGDSSQLRRAFASYASEDRAEVLARVQGMRAVAPDLDVFLDALALRSGEQWEARVDDELREREALFLFWSGYAARSRWVRFEWEQMLMHKGLQAIRPVPLADPRDAVPPPELASLHFGDAYLGWMLAERARVAAATASPRN